MAICRRLSGITAMMLGALMLSVTSPVSAENPFRTQTQQHGDFVLEYITPQKPAYRDLQTMIKSSGKFEGIIKAINQEFILPQTITVRFAQGDGPVYEPNKKTIAMSYDFIFYLTKLYLQRYPDATDAAMQEYLIHTTSFLFYHEMAHAFIDLYQLPIVSNEETAADNLAVILALAYSKDGFAMVMDSAELFDLLDQAGSKKYAESDYWDEHALDAQRFYNILCMVYGKYPEEVTQRLENVNNKKLLKFVKQKGDYCSYMYQQQVNAWSRLLTPYIKN